MFNSVDAWDDHIRLHVRCLVQGLHESLVYMVIVYITEQYELKNIYEGG